MPGEKEKLDLDFGIEETLNGGTPEILSFLNKDTTNPDDLLPASSTTDGSSTTKAPSSTTGSSTTKAPKKALTDEEIGNMILGGGDPEDEEEEDENPDETTEVDKTPTGKASEEGTPEDDENTYQTLSKDLVKLGVFTQDAEDEELPTDGKQFLERWMFEKKKQLATGFEDFLGRFGDDYREMFDAVFLKGVTPREYLQTFSDLQDFSTIDLTQESNQEKVFREFFKRQGFDDTKIEVKLQKVKGYGDLEQEVKDYLPSIVSQDQDKLEKAKVAKEQQALIDRRIDDDFQKASNNILVSKVKDKEFDGIPVTTQIAREAFNFLNDKKYKTKSGELLTEYDRFILELKKPENSEMRVKLALLALNKFDLSKVKVKERNEATASNFSFKVKNKETGKRVPTKSAQASDTFI